MRKITTIVVHHSISPRDQTLLNSLNSFNNTHKARLHSDINMLGYHIAYHFVIAGDGTWKQTRGFDEVGYHASNWDVNVGSVGICLSGDFDKEEPTEAQLDSLREICQDICTKYDIKKITGHRAYASKTCPGKHIRDKFLQTLFRKPYIPMDNTFMFDIIKSLPRYNQSEVEGTGNGDCLPYNIQFAGAVNTKRNYQGMEIKVDHSFDEKLRVFHGRDKDSNMGLYAYKTRQIMQETGEHLDIDVGNCIMRIGSMQIRKIKNSLEVFEQYIRKGIPVVMGMTYSSTKGTSVLWDDTPSSVPSKHEITLVGFAANGDGLWYDTSTTTQDPEGIPCVKRIARKLLDTQGNISKQGVYQPFVVLPKIIIK